MYVHDDWVADYKIYHVHIDGEKLVFSRFESKKVPAYCCA